MGVGVWFKRLLSAAAALDACQITAGRDLTKAGDGQQLANGSCLIVPVFQQQTPARVQVAGGAGDDRA